jgi:hypothetical protein
MITLIEKWQMSIDIANEMKLTKFIFWWNGDCFLSEWVKNKWSSPVLIYEL